MLDKRWQGEDLHGKTFAIWSEFGLGDEIMFVQLAHYLKHSLGAAKVIVFTQDPLVLLFQTHPDIDAVFPVKNWQEKQPENEIDYWEFPYALLTHHAIPFSNIPKFYPYLFASPDKISHFAPQCVKRHKPRIGLAWRGSPASEHDAIRSIHRTKQLDELIAQLPDADYYCLQRDLNEAERKWLAKHNIPEFSTQLNDFTDTAGLFSHMDYIISADTSVIHLAGAMNIPSVVMLAERADWRWSTMCQETLWYKSVKRANANSWPDVFHLVAQYVNEHFSVQK